MNGFERRLQEASLKEYQNIDSNYTKFQRQLRLNGHIAKMGTSAFAVYMMLLDHRNNTTGLCCPSKELIAKELGTSIDTIKRAIKKLEEIGYIIKISGNDKKKRNKHGQIKSTPNHYILVPLNYVEGGSEGISSKPTDALPKATMKSKVTEKNLKEAQEILLETNNEKAIGFFGEQAVEHFKEYMIEAIKLHGYYKAAFRDVVNRYSDPEPFYFDKAIIDREDVIRAYRKGPFYGRVFKE